MNHNENVTVMDMAKDLRDRLVSLRKKSMSLTEEISQAMNEAYLIIDVLENNKVEGEEASSPNSLEISNYFNDDGNEDMSSMLDILIPISKEIKNEDAIPKTHSTNLIPSNYLQNPSKTIFSNFDGGSVFLILISDI
jgi:hypothetical protein